MVAEINYFRLSPCSLQILKGLENGTVKLVKDQIRIFHDDKELGPDDPLDISIEVDAEEVDEGKPLKVYKIQVGVVIGENGKKDPGLLFCGDV